MAYITHKQHITPTTTALHFFASQESESKPAVAVQGALQSHPADSIAVPRTQHPSAASLLQASSGKQGSNLADAASASDTGWVLVVAVGAAKRSLLRYCHYHFLPRDSLTTTKSACISSTGHMTLARVLAFSFA
jgi:hypothetical protein